MAAVAGSSSRASAFNPVNRDEEFEKSNCLVVLFLRAAHPSQVQPALKLVMGTDVRKVRHYPHAENQSIYVEVPEVGQGSLVMEFAEKYTQAMKECVEQALDVIKANAPRDQHRLLLDTLKHYELSETALLQLVKEENWLVIKMFIQAKQFDREFLRCVCRSIIAGNQPVLAGKLIQDIDIKHISPLCILGFRITFPENRACRSLVVNGMGVIAELKQRGLSIQQTFLERLQLDHSLNRVVDDLTVYLDNEMRPSDLSEFMEIARSEGYSVVSLLSDLLDRIALSAHGFIEEAIGYLNPREMREIFEEKYRFVNNKTRFTLLLHAVIKNRDVSIATFLVSKVALNMFTQFDICKIKTTFFSAGLLLDVKLDVASLKRELVAEGLTMQAPFLYPLRLRLPAETLERAFIHLFSQGLKPVNIFEVCHFAAENGYVAMLTTLIRLNEKQ